MRDDNSNMLRRGRLAEMIIKLDLTINRKYIWYNKQGKRMLHVQLKKDLTIDYMKHGKVKCALYE